MFDATAQTVLNTSRTSARKNMAEDIPPYIPPPPTKYTLDYAPLVTIDLSTFNDSAAERMRLAQLLADASHNTGFWVVTGHGISDDDIKRQLALGQAFFKRPIEEKREYPCDFEAGSYLGYREPVRFIADTNVKENHEALDIAKFTPSGPRFPLHKFFIKYQDELESFQKQIWERVLKPLLVLIALSLELPEDYFVNLHHYDEKSDDYLCYKIYHPRTDEEWKAIDGKFRPGHTDFGSLTLVFSGTQTVSGLQIRTPEGEWKHVQSIPGGITVNAGDTLSMLTKGYLKSTVHAVRRPPPDQDKNDRLALLYFLRLCDKAEVVPVQSPLLKRLGWLKDEDLQKTEEPVHGVDWIQARVKAYNYRKTIESVNEPRHFQFRDLQVQVQYD